VLVAVPHPVPVATLVAGLGLLGGAVTGIHRFGAQLHGAAASANLEQQRVDYLRVIGDAPPGRHCRHPGATFVPPQAPSSLH
jgi:hypothetical protein